MGRVAPLVVVLMMSLGPLAQAWHVNDPGIDLREIDGRWTQDFPTELEVAMDASSYLSNIDGYFTENLGQLDPSIRYYCMGSPLSVAFGDSWVGYDYRPEGGDRGVMFRAELEGANSVVPQGRQSLATVSNYFLGNEPSEWVTGARGFREVLYTDIYDDIDLRFFFRDGQLKYEFVVMPSGEPTEIRINYLGIDRLSVDKVTGDLRIQTPVGDVLENAPYSFQTSGEKEIGIPTRFIVAGNHQLAFQLGSYEKERDIVIDPALEFSTYIGTSSEDQGSVVNVNENGVIVFAGSTESLGWPTSTGAYDSSPNGMWDIVLTGLSADGSSLEFSTYLGGYSTDSASEIVFDYDDNIILGGHTYSDDFPITKDALKKSNNIYVDCFFTKFNYNGSLLNFSTYFGGSSNDFLNCVDVDGSGCIYGTGHTQSTDLPVTPGCIDASFHIDGTDAFIVRIDAEATKVLACSYLGVPHGSDDGYAIRPLEDGSVLVSGYANGPNFPTTPEAYCTTYHGFGDTFVLKTDGDFSSLIFSTLIGGSKTDVVGDMHTDDLGDIYLCGWTNSPDFPTTTDAFDSTYNGGADTFFLKLNSSGDRLLSSSYFGSGDYDWHSDFELDNCGRILFRLSTNSTDLAVSYDAYDDILNGNDDLYLGRLDLEENMLDYGTYFGGGASESGAIHYYNGLLTLMGTTNSSDMPTTEGAYDTTCNGLVDMFVAQFSFDDAIVNVSSPTAPQNVTVKGLDRVIEISWDPPINSDTLRIRGYYVYSGHSETDFTLLMNVSRFVRSVIDHPVPTGVEVFYAVSARNRAGEGNLSEAVGIIPYGSPRSPMNFTATPGCGTVNLNWKPPKDTGGLPLIGYHLYRGQNPVSMLHHRVLGVTESYQDNGLENGQEYFYKVCAFNSMWNGTNSTVASVIPMGLPSVPQLFHVKQVGDSTVVLEWRQPLLDGGSAIMGYRLFRGDSETTLGPIATPDYLTVTYNDGDLTNGHTYYYAILAYNLVGDGPLSPVANATPVGLPGVPLNLRAEAGDASVILTWNGPASNGGTPLMGYHIQRGLASDQLSWLADTVELTYTDVFVTNGVTLYYRVSAYNRVGDGPASSTVDALPLGPCAAPGDLAIEPGNGIITLTWLIPLETGGSPIDQFGIYRGTSAETLEPHRVLEPSSTSYSDYDVNAGTTYYYAVAAITAAGEGMRSAVASATPYGPPGAPLDLTATAGDGKVSLAWAAPASDGGSPIDGYVLLRGLSIDSLQVLEMLADVHAYTDRAVQNGVTYFYAIASTNAAGQGDASAIVNATPLRPATVPGKIRTLIAEAKGVEVTLTWTLPESDGGSPVTGYVVLRGASRDALVVVATLGTVTVWTDAAVERGSTYYYTVAAINAVGQGEAFAAYEVKVPKEQKEEPGFGAIGMGVALATAVLMMASRRQRGRGG